MLTTEVAEDLEQDFDLLAEALFCSWLQPSSQPSEEQIREAIIEEIGLNGSGVEACLAACAFEAGEHPLESARRMAWCRKAVRSVFGPAAARA